MVQLAWAPYSGSCHHQGCEWGIQAMSALTDPLTLSSVLSAGDNINTLAPVLHMAYDDAQSLAEFYAPMKTVLIYLERLVQAVDAASEASGGCKRNDPGMLIQKNHFPRFTLLQRLPS
jgi:hypothetical protein